MKLFSVLVFIVVWNLQSYNCVFVCLLLSSFKHNSKTKLISIAWGQKFRPKSY